MVVTQLFGYAKDIDIRLFVACSDMPIPLDIDFFRIAGGLG